MRGKPFYTEYINHCLRFYCRNTERPAFKSNADKANWMSCESVMKTLDPTERDIIVAVYLENDSFSDNVFQVSKRFKADHDKVWESIHNVSRRIAKQRGLL